MKAQRPSRTAEHNALFRAIESSRSPQARIVDDGLARHFLGRSFRLAAALAHIPVLAGAICQFIDYRWPGSRTSLIARTRWIDDRVRTALAAGVSQIVILGAGFDSRAYRLPGAEQARFFEVDHPNTSAAKRARIRSIFGALPEHIKYLAVDFQHDDLQLALQAEGFSPKSKTLVLWEGVSNYLTEEAVRKTLNFVASLGAGTGLIFTYVDRSVIRDPRSFRGGSEVQRLFAKLEEPWTFGLSPAEAPTFFRQCGLALDSDLSAAEYRELYYKTAKPILGYEFYHVVAAHVSGSEDQSLIHHLQEARNFTAFFDLLPTVAR